MLKNITVTATPSVTPALRALIQAATVAVARERHLGLCAGVGHAAAWHTSAFIAADRRAAERAANPFFATKHNPLVPRPRARRP